MKKTWKPIGAGILDILYGIVVISLVIYHTNWKATLENPLWIISFGWLTFLTISGILAILGGFFALIRKEWILALIGTIAVFFFIFSMILGIPALILLLKSKKEFT